MFFLSVISPLRWPFPFIPFLNKDNQELLASPIPLIACVLEHAKASSPDLNFFSNDPPQDDSAVHFHLDLDKRRGIVKVDLKEMTAESGIYKRLKEARQKIKKEYPHDFLLKNLYEPKHRQLLKHLGVFVDEIKALIASIYFKSEELKGLTKSESGTYSGVKSTLLNNTDYDKNSMDILLSSQAFQMYLEKRDIV